MSNKNKNYISHIRVVYFDPRDTNLATIMVLFVPKYQRVKQQYATSF